MHPYHQSKTPRLSIVKKPQLSILHSPLSIIHSQPLLQHPIHPGIHLFDRVWAEDYFAVLVEEEKSGGAEDVVVFHRLAVPFAEVAVMRKRQVAGEGLVLLG